MAGRTESAPERFLAHEAPDLVREEDGWRVRVGSDGFGQGDQSAQKGRVQELEVDEVGGEDQVGCEVLRSDELGEGEAVAPG